MITLKKIVLDVLKPHTPDAISFAKAIANIGPGYQVQLVVLEMDENTQTLELEVSAAAIDFDAVQKTLQELGASLHSIDEVDVINEPETT